MIKKNSDNITVVLDINFTDYTIQDFRTFKQFTEYNNLCRKQQYSDSRESEYTIPFSNCDLIEPDSDLDKPVILLEDAGLDPDFNSFIYTDNQLRNMRDLNSGYNVVEPEYTMNQQLDYYGLKGNNRAICLLLWSGYTRQEICEELSLSEPTLSRRIDSIKAIIVNQLGYDPESRGRGKEMTGGR